MSDGNIGHNQPPSAVDTFRDRLAMRAKAVLELPPLTAETSGKYKDEKELFKTLKREIEATHKTEKQPFLDGGRKVDAAYKPLAEEAERRALAINDKLEAFAKAEKKKAEEAARIAAEALRKAEEEAAAKAAKPEPEDEFLAFLEEPAPDLEQIAADAKLAEAQALAAKRVGSEAGGFRASTLRTVKKLRVMDFAKLVAHYASHPDMKALAERLANADLRHARGAEITFPGAEVYDDEVLR
jgi:hypothetical protein